MTATLKCILLNNFNVCDLNSMKQQQGGGVIGPAILGRGGSHVHGGGVGGVGMVIGPAILGRGGSHVHKQLVIVCVRLDVHTNNCQLPDVHK